MNAHRFQRDFCAIAQFGILANGGVSRLAFTKEDQDARNYLIQQMQAAGLEVTVDGFGNIRGRRAGRDNHLPAVIMGSHLDTVPQGGHYDGVIGVLAGLEVIRTLNDQQITTKHPIELINFAAEESSRFGLATLGSKGITGQLSCDQAKQITDREGLSLYDVLTRSGYPVDNAAEYVLDADSVAAFLELHIEQGPVLENEGIDVGLVTAIAAPSRFKLTIVGRSDHSGNTPMTMRQDALVAAAELVLAVEQLAVQASDSAVATVGVLEVQPNAMNVIPGQVSMTIDLRDTDMAQKDRLVQQLQQTIDEISQRRGVVINCHRLCHDRPVQLDSALLTTLEQIAQQRQLSSKQMPSGAGHDAMHLAGIAPTALIFVPSIDGVSHNVGEKSTLQAISKGADLLCHAVRQLAG